MVFTQFDGQEDGTLLPLPKKNIDTGMGLERMAAIMQGVPSNFETDIIRGLVSVGEQIFDKKYGQDKETDLSLRVIADHSRAICFMIADGILPGNEGREYVLRRLLRRCVMKAFLMEKHKPFLHNYIDEIIAVMGDVYPELVDNKKLIKCIVQAEEERFGQTLSQGAELLNKILSIDDNEEDFTKLPKEERPLIPGEDVFMLHDTYGFPMEVTQEIAESRGFEIDVDAFKACMKEQVERARAANASDAEAAWDVEGNIASDILTEIGATEFFGYDKLFGKSKVLALLKDGKRVDILRRGEQGSLFVAKTPFYGEMGGQVGDTGRIIVDDKNIACVEDTVIPEKGLIAHNIKVEKGVIRVNDDINLEVDKMRRARISRNHTATHVLHWALREVLGDHVKQAGSYVAPERLRFDFTHFEAVTPDELKKIEKLANNKVMGASNVTTYNTSLKDARKKGVTALFGEKYDEDVRVVNVGEFSHELCGGCHVNNTSEIGLIKITNETSVGANARRIEACTSFDAYDYCTYMIELLNEASFMLRCNPKQISAKIDKQKDQIKLLKENLEISLDKAQGDVFGQIIDNLETTNAGYKLCIRNILQLEGRDIRKA